MSSLGSLSRTLGKLSAAAQITGRQILHLDTNPVPRTWTHVTKVDPEPGKLFPLLYPLYLQHTDAIAVGGSQGVDAQATEETFQLLSRVTPPAFHEPSSAKHVTSSTLADASFLAVPEVLNGDSTALVGTLGEGLDYVRTSLAPDQLSKRLPDWVPSALRGRLAEFLTSWLLHEAVFEAYIIQNPDSAAAREANVSVDDILSTEEARQRALAAERHLESEIIYLEYSGMYGGEDAIATLRELEQVTSWSRIWYGGGLTSSTDVAAVRDAGADTVVVGDVFHDIAREELSLYERVSDELDTESDVNGVQRWIERNVDPNESAAVQYLDTVPGVENPISVARQYLTVTMSVGRRLRIHDTDTGAVPDHDSQWVKPLVATLPERYLPEVPRSDVQAFINQIVSFDESTIDGQLHASHLSILTGERLQ